MPRPKVRKETVIISLAVDRDLALRLKEEARRRGVSVSRLAEHLLSLSLEATETAAGSDLATNGGGSEGESESEKRWRLLKMLDEPILERLPLEVEQLSRWIERLAATPVSTRRTERFLNERARARRKLAYLKREARRLLAAGYELEEGVVGKLIELEKALDAL